MAEKLTQEQLNGNFGTFIHANLFLNEMKKLEDAIGSGGGSTPTGIVKKVNNKTPNASGAVVIAGADIIPDSQVPGTNLETLVRNMATDISANIDPTELTTALADYETKSDLTTKLALKADKTQLADYTKTADLATTLATDQLWTDLVARVEALEKP